jgi:hypothetical protein
MMRHSEPSEAPERALGTQPLHHVASPHQAIASHLTPLSQLGVGGLLPGGIAGHSDMPNALPDTTATAPPLRQQPRGDMHAARSQREAAAGAPAGSSSKYHLGRAEQPQAGARELLAAAQGLPENQLTAGGRAGAGPGRRLRW